MKGLAGGRARSMRNIGTANACGQGGGGNTGREERERDDNNNIIIMARVGRVCRHL